MHWCRIVERTLILSSWNYHPPLTTGCWRFREEQACMMGVYFWQLSCWHLMTELMVFLLFIDLSVLIKGFCCKTAVTVRPRSWKCEPVCCGYKPFPQNAEEKYFWTHTFAALIMREFPVLSQELGYSAKERHILDAPEINSKVDINLQVCVVAFKSFWFLPILERHQRHMHVTGSWNPLCTPGNGKNEIVSILSLHFNV